MRTSTFLHAVNVSRFPASKSMATGSGKMFHEVKCMLAYKVTKKLSNSSSIKQNLRHVMFWPFSLQFKI